MAELFHQQNLNSNCILDTFVFNISYICRTCKNGKLDSIFLGHPVFFPQFKNRLDIFNFAFMGMLLKKEVKIKPTNYCVGKKVISVL